MTVLFLFLIGFSMLVTAMNTPFYQLTEVDNIIIGPGHSGVFQEEIGGQEVVSPVNCPTYPSATETTGDRASCILHLI